MKTCLVALCALLAGCAEPFDTETAYEGEPYLCDAAHAAELAAELAACRKEHDRDARACGGVVSFRGTLQGQHITVSTGLSSALFANERRDTDVFRERYDASGDSPYFRFTLQLKEVGGAADEGMSNRMLTVGAGSPLTALTDDLVEMSLRLSAGGDSKDFHARSGSLSLTLQAANEAAGRFDMTLGSAEEKLEGCFHFLATRVTTEQAVMP